MSVILYYNSLTTNFKKVLPKSSPYHLQYKIHKRWLLLWNHFIVIIRVATSECFKMQMVINLAPVSLRNKQLNFYTRSRLTFLKKKCHCGKSLKERCVCPQTPLAARALGARNLPRLVLKSGYGPDK